MLTTASQVFFIIVSILPVHGRVIQDMGDITNPTPLAVHDITQPTPLVVHDTTQPTPSGVHDMHDITDPTSSEVTIGQTTEIASEVLKHDDLGGLTKGKQQIVEEIDQEEDQVEVDQVIEHALHGDSASASDGHGGTRQELDMWLTREQDEMLHGGQMSRQKRKAHYSLAYRWSNNEVWYRRAPGVFSDKYWRKIEKAMKEWEEMTCITFHEDVDETRLNHVYIDTGEGCTSYVGMIGYRQRLTLGNGCVAHTIILHELGHAIGFLHEHNRPDRDDYVNIWWDNIESKYSRWFEKYPRYKVNYYNVPYDFLSVMHYGPRAFSKNRNYTIVAIDPQNQNVYGYPGQLSFYDVMLANRMYKCDSKCVTSSACPEESYRGKDCKCYCRGPTVNDPVQECGGDTPVVTRRPVTVTSRPVTNCRDLHGACSSWTSTSRRICVTHGVVAKLCPKSCGTCKTSMTTTTTEPTTTRTTRRPITTSTTTTIGTSRRPTTSRPTTRGPTTRRPTTRRPTTSRPTTRRPTTRRPTTRRPTTRRPTTRRPCTDWNGACPHWASITGLCRRIDINRFCQKSCGTCTV